MSRSSTLSTWIRFSSIAVLAVTALAITPAMAAEKKNSDHGKVAKTTSLGSGHWAYHGDGGPSHWGDLSPSFAACGKGMSQSPVDLHNANTNQFASYSVHGTRQL